MPSVMLEKMCRYCSKQHLPLICDTWYIHQPAWGCNEANWRGQQLFDFLITTDLEVKYTPQLGLPLYPSSHLISLLASNNATFSTTHTLSALQTAMVVILLIYVTFVNDLSQYY